MSSAVSSVVSQSSSMSTVSSTTSMVVTKKQTSHATMTSKSSSSKVVTSSGEEGSGLDFEAELARMQSKLDAQMVIMKQKALSLLPMSSSGIKADEDLIKLDHQTIQQYVDPASKDRVKFSFDVQEFQKESVVVQSKGNTIEVRAKKTVQQGDNEATEEYTRTYELPSGINTRQLSTAMSAGGDTFTVELPLITVNQA